MRPILAALLITVAGCGSEPTSPARPTPEALPNRAPVAVDTIPGVTLTEGGEAARVEVSGHFRDPDGDTLIYAAASSDAKVATASASGSTVTVTRVAAGEAAVTVTASDPGGLSATQSFAVTAPSPAPSAPGTPVAAGMQDQLAIRWAKAAGVVTGYEIVTCRGQSDCDTTLVGDTTEVVVTTGHYYQWHEIRVRAWNKETAGPWSETVKERTGREGVILAGTVWESGDVITGADPSVLDSVVYVGRGMRGFYDPLEGSGTWRDDLDLFLFEAHFAGGTIMEVQAHPAYVEADSARAAAMLFVPPIGRLPRALIDGGREIELSPAAEYGAGGNGCGKIYHWGGTFYHSTSHAGKLEEVALHEGSHAILEGCAGRFPADDGLARIGHHERSEGGFGGLPGRRA